MDFKLMASADTYGNTLVEIGESNDHIFAIDADLMKASGSKPFKEKFPDRHINVGVAEQNLVGVAAGLAAMGRIPFACTMSNFMSQRACDQVTIAVAYNKFNVKIVGCFAGLSQEKNGGTHIGVMDIAIMRCLPNMRVIAPSDRKELHQVLKTAAKAEGPTYIRMARYLPDSIFDTSYKFDLGKGFQISNGSDITLISTGISSMVALDSLSELKKEGIDARLVHLPSIKPVDLDMIVKCAKDTGAIITVEDHSIYGGIGGLVSEIVSKNYPVLVSRVGMNDVFGLTAPLDFQLSYYGITAENIVSKTKEILRLK